MLVVQFAGMRLVEYADARAFDARAGRWLAAREAENCYLLGALHELLKSGVRGASVTRCFTVEDRESVVAAAMVFPGSNVATTWATPEMKSAMVDGFVRSGVPVASFYGPAHVSGELAQLWVQRTGHKFEYDRDERVYQLVNVTHTPRSGRLEIATEADRPLVMKWLEAFSREASFEMASQLDGLCKSMLQTKALYLWKDPEPVSMASWVNPTPKGACINTVYTPPEFRGRGYGKAVCAALASRMLASGLKYVFILTDTADRQTNHMYQAIGARTVTELVRCVIVPNGPRFGQWGR